MITGHERIRVRWFASESLGGPFIAIGGSHVSQRESSART